MVFAGKTGMGKAFNLSVPQHFVLTVLKMYQ